MLAPELDVGQEELGAMARKIILSAVASMLMLLTFAHVGSAATGTSLLLPQSTAFSVLGRSCGGIQEQAFATGFDAVSGYPKGDVYLQTRCGGSGRGGGYRTTTYSAWVGVTWDFTGAVGSYAKLATAPTGLDPSFSVTDAHGDQLYNVLTARNVLPANCTVGNTTYCTYRAYLNVVVPAAPTGVVATLAGGQYQVSWLPDPTAANLISSSTVTATPQSPSTAPVITATVSGSATSLLLGPLEPLTTYQVTVVNVDAGGSSPASTPISIATSAASTPPSAPGQVTLWWTGQVSPGPSLGVQWVAAVPGDSPTDQYEIAVTWVDGDTPGGSYTQTVDGQTLSAYFAVDNTSVWEVQVRAHNAAGWGPWSAAVKIDGV
jgi:hypothetical protein